ncbi:MAG: hypothetical protein E7361_01090 [Clostridiales bacterium]|nr:hypothetical protein [Clostridiales bacterium]
MGTKSIDSLAQKVNNLGQKAAKKSKKGIIAVTILIAIVVALAVVLVIFIGNSGVKPDQTFTATNVNATVTVTANSTKIGGDSTILLVDGKESAELEFNAEGSAEPSTQHLEINADTTLNSGSMIQLFYKFENRSSSAMYITFGKEVADDNNFMISIFFRATSGNLQTVNYYTANGKYYTSISDMNGAVNALDTISMTNGPKVDAGSSLTMRIELSVIKPNTNANINCNFAFNMINENDYTA